MPFYDEFLHLLVEADDTPLGVVVETNDPKRLAERLRAAKRDHPDLAHIELCTSPYSPATELILLRRKPKEPPPDDAEPPGA